MKCKIVLNRESGNFRKLNVDALLRKLGCDATVEFIDSQSQWSAANFDTVIVCGGDGTLHNAIGKCRGKRLVYIPCGTLNEAAATSRKMRKVCSVNGEPFSYVCATGSFTEIGYSAKNSAKRHWKSLAYLPEVFKNYRCHEISAQISLDGQKFDGVYTLLMVLKSQRCFGFCFNKDYKKTGKSYLLAIKSVGKDCFFNRLKLFLPMFRVFFCGAKPNVKKSYILLPFDNLTICVDSPQNFCVDGEKRTLQNTLNFSDITLDPPIEIVYMPSGKNPKKNYETI